MANVIVWEWQTENDNWKAYDPHVCSAIETSFRTTKALKLGEIEPALSAYEVDLSSLQQKRIDTGTVRTVRQSIFPPKSAPAKNVTWQWFDDSSQKWLPYDLKSMCIVEEEYCSKNYRIDLSKTKCALPYVVDTVNMIQTRIDSGYRRRIRRIPLTSPYPIQDEHFEVSSSGVAAVDLSECENKADDSDDDGDGDSGDVATIEQVSNDQTVEQTQHSRKWKSKQTVAAVHGVHKTLAWSSPEPTGQQDDIPVEVQEPSNDSKKVPRSMSEPGAVGGSDLKASETDSIGQLQGPSTSGTRPKVKVASSRNGSKRGMSRSQSMPVTITARAAHAAGPLLSPVMTCITSMLMSPVIPSIRINHTPVPVFNPPHTSRSGIKPVPGIRPSKKRKRKSFLKVNCPNEVVKNYVTKLKEAPDENCPICVGPLKESSDFQEDNEDEALKLKKCGHIFHNSCLQAMYLAGPKDGSIQCPTCKTIYGVKHGNQPPGHMDYHVIPHSLQSFNDCSTIRIIYEIPPGTQGPEHPQPGKKYTANFPRHCYLPDNEMGRKILKLLIVAWDRRLIFTIGTSATTGQSNTVVWNEIHHKTEFGSNVTGHGYPDPNYFQNILAELKAQGVTEDCLD
ncbi:E3 ubiquitin-protein ligase DTX4-like [Antedon mediterranea]|uniref:E3 ubiquitin-protein ligase DTX4-like n=1 Tax=Antedon mediterranea TaxID=105859 RepID=UPI003AF76A34